MENRNPKSLAGKRRRDYQVPVLAGNFRAGLYAPAGSVTGGELLHIPMGK